MNFDFDEQQTGFHETFARFLGESFPLEQHERRTKLGRGAYDDIWRGLAELGLFAPLTPEEHGGLGLGFVDLALIVEELGRCLAPLSICETLVATDVIARFAEDAAKARYLPAIVAGELRVALATLEADAGFDPQAISATLDRDGAAQLLSGRKILVPHGAEASLLLATARTDDGRVCVVMVEPGADGVSMRPHNSLDPSCALVEVQFERAPVTFQPLLGGALERLFDASVAVAAGLQVGIAGKALDLTVEYAGARVQFGKPIGAFQAVKHRCADMAVAHDGARSAAYYAFWAVAEDARDRPRAASVAKAFCGEAARMICQESIQVHGGMGFTWELGLHHYLRRAQILEYAWGDVAFHRERSLRETLSSLNLADAAILPHPTDNGGKPCKSAA